jgi:hypothetical protein
MPTHKAIINLPDSYPIVIKKDVAVNFGLKEAIVLYQINYWVKNNEKYNKNFKCGRWWTYNTMEQWKEQFPFWSLATIHNIFKKLRNDRIIFAEKLNQDPSNHVMFYTLNIEENEESNLPEKLLFGSKSIVVSKELAYKIGLNEAVVLEYIRSWMDYNQNHHQNFHNNKYWVFNTMEEWQKEIEFFSLRTLERIFQNLFKEGLLIKANFNQKKSDRTNWYTINYEHKIFKKSNEIINEEIKAEIRNNTDLAQNSESSTPPIPADLLKMAESVRHPIPADLLKMAEWIPPFLVNHIVTSTTTIKQKKDTRARETFSIDNFMIKDDDKDAIMKEEELESNQFMQAFKEFVLFCKKKNPDEEKSYEMFLNGLHLWCTRYHEVKKTKSKTKIKLIKNEEEKLKNLMNWAQDFAENQSSQEFYEHMIQKMGYDNFTKAGMLVLQYHDITDGFLRLKFAYANTERISPIRTHQKEITNAVKSFKDDLKGIKFLSQLESLLYEIKFKDG